MASTDNWSRATTPTHTFKLGTAISNIDKFLLVYSQSDKMNKILLVKHLNDMTVSGTDTVSVKLTQEETNLFRTGAVYIQIRIKTKEGNVVKTPIYTRPVEDVLDDEVL